MVQPIVITLSGICVFQLYCIELYSIKCISIRSSTEFNLWKKIIVRLFPCRLRKDLKMRSGHDQFFRRETKRISYIDFVGIFLDIKVGGLDYLEHESQPRPRWHRDKTKMTLRLDLDETKMRLKRDWDETETINMSICSWWEWGYVCQEMSILSRIFIGTSLDSVVTIFFKPLLRLTYQHWPMG